MADLSPLMVEILQRGGSVELTVTGSSMWPMLLHRVSRVRLASVQELKKGDIPLYRRTNGAFVLHRIVDAENGIYTCCGDNQWHFEFGLEKKQMIAIVTDFCRKNRWISVNNRGYGLYWHTWLIVLPLRKLLFGGWRRIKRLCSSLIER